MTVTITKINANVLISYPMFHFGMQPFKILVNISEIIH